MSWVSDCLESVVKRWMCSADWQPSPLNRVHWQWGGGSGMPAIEFTGVPFMFVGSKRLVCHQGKDLAVSQKRKYFEEKARKMVSSLPDTDDTDTKQTLQMMFSFVLVL